MPTAAIFVKWGNPINGREKPSLEVFMSAMQYFGGLKAQGVIEDHRTYIATTGNSNDFAGFMTVEGEVAQLRRLVDSTEYQTLLLKARHLVDNIDEVHCISGSAIPAKVEQIVSVRKELGLG